MDAYETLRQQAKAKRERAIRAARDDYRRTVAEIAALRGKLQARTIRPVKSHQRRLGDDRQFSELSATVAAERVLLEGTPLRITELTVEIQRRGCRAGDDARAVAHAIRGGFLYHRKRFKRDKAGRWAIIS